VATRVSDRAQRLADLLARVPVGPVPLPAPNGHTLLEVGFLAVLQRRLSESAAEKTLVALAGAYPDWNELRVSQGQEFQHLVQTKSPEIAVQVTRDVREYLQEIFQKIHGFNLEALRGDVTEAARFASQVPFLGATVGHYLLYLACPEELPVSPSIVRSLDRLGFAKRTSSLKKAQAGIEGLVPPEARREFVIRIGRVIENWCDPKKPICWQCPLVDACPFGKKVLREWKATQRRLEIQRARDEERARKEAEKERKRAVAEEKRRLIAKARDDARKSREAERAKARVAAGGKKKPAASSSRKKSVPKKSVHKKVTRPPARKGPRSR
jgi:endonuclease III